MSYAKAVEKFEKESGIPQVRTDYRCSANGCPLMGGIGGQYGVNKSGVCRYHYAEPDHTKWGAVTLSLRAKAGL